MARQTAARVQQELAAQRARAEALRHLQATGSGPSQRELERERQRRAQLASRVSSAVARRVAPAVQEATAGGFDPRVRDNTLQAVARARASELQQTSGAADGGGGGERRLPDGWRAATDPASGDAYYWNERTQETAWERPGEAEQEQEDEEELPGDWRAVVDPQSGDKYYWNSVTNETAWTKPEDASVSLQQALKAKSKLDSILKAVDSGATRTQRPADAKQATASQTQQHVPTQAQPHAHTTSSDSSGAKRVGRPNESAINATKRRKPNNSEVDPMDPTGTGGKWSDGGHIQISEGLLSTSLVAANTTMSTSPTRTSPSPVRSPTKRVIKARKHERKAKEQDEKYIRELNAQVGRLEDRDTQQKAFLALINSLPQLDPSRVPDVFLLMEKNKNPSRSSTRRMLLLLMAVLCRYHPSIMSKLLHRILAYISLRLRDNEARVTDACAIVVSAISMYVLGHPGSASTAGLNETGNHSAIVQFATALLKDTSAVGEGTARCMCALIYPTEFDGVSRPPADMIVAHSRRFLSYLSSFVVDSSARMDGSSNYPTFSSTFLQLTAAYALAYDTDQQGKFSGLKECFATSVESVFEAIEDSFKYGPREDWVLRKRAIELLSLLMNTYALGNQEGESRAAQKYFNANQERCRALVLAARHDPVSSVRDAAIAAVRAFDLFEKQYPNTNPPTASATISVPCQRLEFSNGPIRSSRKLSGRKDPRSTPTVVTVSTEELPTESKQGESDEDANLFGESGGDEAAAPEETETVSMPSEEGSPTKPAVSISPSRHEVELLTERKPKARVRRSTREPIPRISPPKRKVRERQLPFPAFEELPDCSVPETEAEEDTEPDDTISEPVTGAEAALSAAKCGESELALRLCLLEDDVNLLRQTLSLLGTPCLSSLSRPTRNAICVALLTLLDDDDGRSGDAWIALEWLESLSDSDQNSSRQLDARIRHALAEKLSEMSFEPTRLALAAAKVLDRLHL